MKLESKKFLFDIQTSISAIDEHLQGKRDYNYFISNKTARRAVERELEIIGEAMNRFLKLEPNIQITYARLILDLRNKVIHSYDSVNNDIIWKVVIKDIPILKEEIELLLS